jgi:hypothetical protein
MRNGSRGTRSLCGEANDVNLTKTKKAIDINGLLNARAAA